MMSETLSRKLTQAKGAELAYLVRVAKKPAHALRQSKNDSELIEQISMLERDCIDVNWTRYNTTLVDKLIVSINERLPLINELSKGPAILELWRFIQLLRGQKSVENLLGREHVESVFSEYSKEERLISRLFTPEYLELESHRVAPQNNTFNVDLPSYKNDRLQGQIAQLEKRQSEVNREAKNKLSQISSDGEEQLNKIRRETTKGINSLVTQLDDHLATLSSHNETEKSQILREIREEITSYSKSLLEASVAQFHEQTSSQAQDVETQVNELSERVQKEVDEFVGLNAELRKSLAYIASDKLADSSKKQADQERSTANWLRIYGIAWLLATIWYFIGKGFNVSDYLDPEGNPMYTMLIMRGFFVAFCSAPGFYMLRESARHRTDERRYNQKSIQLASIDGYFAEHAKDERTKAKNDLAKHYFNGDDHFVDASSVDKTQSSYDRVFDAVLKNKKAK